MRLIQKVSTVRLLKKLKLIFKIRYFYQIRHTISYFSTKVLPLLRHLSQRGTSFYISSSCRRWPPVTTDGRSLRGSSWTFYELRSTVNPFPHHSIIHGIFTVYFTYLTTNMSQIHISCIKITDNRPYFTVGGALDHLEYSKRTEQYLNTICFSHIGVCGLSVSERWRRACAKLGPQRFGGNIRKRFVLSECASYFPVRISTKLQNQNCNFKYHFHT
jgi:hypothetical protein